MQRSIIILVWLAINNAIPRIQSEIDTNIGHPRPFLVPTCSTDEYPNDSNDDEDSEDRFCVGEDRIGEEEQRSLCARLIDGPVSRRTALQIAKRMVELLQRPRTSEAGCRISPTVNLAAQRLIEFMTQETYSFLSDDDLPPTPEKKQRIDDDYCELYAIPNSRRRISLSTMRIICDMIDRKATPRTIKAKYYWYTDSLLEIHVRCSMYGVRYSCTTSLGRTPL